MASALARRWSLAWLPVVVVLAPALFRVERLAHPSPWLLALASVVVYVTQPTPSRAALRSPVDRFSALAIVVAANLGSLAPVIEFVARPELRPPALSWQVLVGGALMAAGVALRVWAISTLGAAFTAVVQTTEGQQLVEGGPYRWLRHPSYTGVLLSLVGAAAAFESVAALVALVALMLPAYVFRIRIEEAALEAHFGEPYRRFAATRWALLPPLY